MNKTMEDENKHLKLKLKHIALKLFLESKRVIISNPSLSLSLSKEARSLYNFKNIKKSFLKKDTFNNQDH